MPSANPITTAYIEAEAANARHMARLAMSRAADDLVRGPHNEHPANPCYCECEPQCAFVGQHRDIQDAAADLIRSCIDWVTA